MPMLILALTVLICTAALFFFAKNEKRFVRKKPRQNNASGVPYLNEDLDELKKRAKDVKYKEEE